VQAAGLFDAAVVVCHGSEPVAIVPNGAYGCNPAELARQGPPLACCALAAACAAFLLLAVRAAPCLATFRWAAAVPTV